MAASSAGDGRLPGLLADDALPPLPPPAAAPAGPVVPAASTAVVTLVPDEGQVELTRCSCTGRWALSHAGTGEVHVFPAGVECELSFDEGT